MPPTGFDLVWRLLEDSVRRVNKNRDVTIHNRSTEVKTNKNNIDCKVTGTIDCSKFELVDNQSSKRKRQDSTAHKGAGQMKKLKKEKTCCDNLTRGLVLNYMKDRAPSLQEEFRALFSFQPTHLQLEEVVTAFKNHRETVVLQSYLPEESEEEEEEEYEVVDIADEEEDEDDDVESEGEETINVSDEEYENIVINPFYQPDLIEDEVEVIREVVADPRSALERAASKKLKSLKQLRKSSLGKKEMDFNEDQLTRGLILNYLKEALPELTGDFELSFSPCQQTQLQLAEVVKHYRKTRITSKGHKSKAESTQLTTKDKKVGGRKNRPTGTNIRRFSHAEDEVIREAIQNAADGKIDCNAIAKRLSRGNRSIQMRIESLKLNNGIHRYKNYSQTEDFTILETLILPRLLKQEKLSEIVLSNCHYEQIAKDLNRRVHSVRNRWQGSLQPCLLKYYAGTLNLQVEKMLAEHIGDTYTDFSEINWPVVAERPDFAGHTERSLKNMYFQVLMNTTKKGLKRKSDVTVAEIAKYIRENKLARKINAYKWQQPLISFFQQRTEQLGIKIRDSL